MKKTIEICCCSVDDAVCAFQGGADRIELNSALEAGGLTPTLGCLLEAKKQIPIPIITMIRPRTGGFCYTDLEFETMKQDAEIMLEHGADGIAVGILNKDSTIDLNRTKFFTDLCHEYKKDCVFHRAIDITPNLLEATQQLILLGVTRILTSGGHQRCLEGIDTINQLLNYSDKIQILACGSIRSTNIAEIISKTSCKQFHMALMENLFDPTMRNTMISFNGVPSENQFKMISQKAVKEVINIIEQL